MRKSRDRQLGISLPAILFWLVFAVFVVTLMVRLGPIYAANWTLGSIMSEVAHLPDALDGGKKEIRENLRRRLEINDVGIVGAGDFTIEEGPGGTYDLAVDYEVRQHLFFNVDVVLSFKHEVSVTGR